MLPRQLAGIMSKSSSKDRIVHTIIYPEDTANSLIEKVFENLPEEVQSVVNPDEHVLKGLGLWEYMVMKLSSFCSSI